MSTPPRPDCPVCRRPVDRLQSSAPPGRARRGPVAAVPCGHWLTQAQAAAVVQRRRTLAATAPDGRRG